MEIIWYALDCCIVFKSEDTISNVVCFKLSTSWHWCLLLEHVFYGRVIYLFILFITFLWSQNKSYKWRTHCLFTFCVWFTGTVVVRILIFPIVILSQRNSAKMSNNLPQLQTLQLKMTEARQTGNQLEGKLCFSVISAVLRVNWTVCIHNTMCPRFFYTSAVHWSEGFVLVYEMWEQTWSYQDRYGFAHALASYS
jgi:hypothetical protein